MYKQENKAGKRDFFKTLGLATVAIVASEFLGGLINFVSMDKINANISGDIVLAGFAVLLVMLVYNHYASVFTYKINSKGVTIEKKAGSRVTEYSFPVSEIKKASIRVGMPKLRDKKKRKKLRLSRHFLLNKKSTVLIVGEEENIVIFEPDDKFIKKLKEHMND